MGIRLIVEVMDHAPAELTAAERMVLVVIAENANDGDPKRATWPGFNVGVLAKRSGLTGDALKKALQRLAGRGMEVRIPIAIGKDGRPLFAVPGKQCRYRLPLLEGGNVVLPSVDEGGNVVLAGGTTVLPKGGTQSPQPGPQSPPSPRSSSKTPPLSPPAVPNPTPQPPAAPEDERENSATPPNDNDTAAVAAAWSTARGARRNPAAERDVAASAGLLLAAGWPLPDVIALAEDMARRQPTYRDLTRHADHWQPARPVAVAPSLPPWCGECADGGLNAAAVGNAKFRTLGDNGSGAKCPRCHPDAMKVAA